MKIKWIGTDDSRGAVTVYENNITLSKKAADFFNDAYAIAIGVDDDSNNVIIKNVSKEEAESNVMDSNHLYKISIKASYGRITGKQMIDELKSIFGFDFSKQPAYKFNARWNNGDRMLIVETGGTR